MGAGWPTAHFSAVSPEIAPLRGLTGPNHGSGASSGAVAAIIRDVSARWQREKDLKERIRVLEAGQAG